MSNSFTKRVLITGASRGIGRAIASLLSSEHYQLVLHGRSKSQALEESVEQVYRNSGQQPAVLCFDVSNRDECEREILTDIENNGFFYGVVCNAGLTADNIFPAMRPDQWDNVLRTNLDSFYNVLHPLIMPMIQGRKGGRIVTLSSISGISGNRGQVNYSASKAGIIGASKALSQELAKRNITVNCIAPGLIETDMTADLPKEQILPHIPMRRLGKPEEVAAAVKFFLSDQASYITGQVLSVNGGML